MDKLFAFNLNDTTLKFRLYEMPSRKILCSGMAVGIGRSIGSITFKANGVERTVNTELSSIEFAVRVIAYAIIETKIVKDEDEYQKIPVKVEQFDN